MPNSKDFMTETTTGDRGIGFPGNCVQNRLYNCAELHKFIKSDLQKPVKSPVVYINNQKETMADWISFMVQNGDFVTQQYKVGRIYKTEDDSDDVEIPEDEKIIIQLVYPLSTLCTHTTKENWFDRFSVTLLLTGNIMRVSRKSMKIHLMRSLNYINMVVKCGHFLMDFQTGQISFISFILKPTALKLNPQKDERRHRLMLLMLARNFSHYMQAFLPRILATLNLPNFISSRNTMLEVKRGFRTRRRPNSWCCRDPNQQHNLFRPNNQECLQNYSQLSSLVSPNSDEKGMRWTISSNCDFLEMIDLENQPTWQPIHSGQTYQVFLGLGVPSSAVIGNITESFQYLMASRRHFVKKQEREGLDQTNNELNILKHLNNYSLNPNIVKPLICSKSIGNVVIQYNFEVSLESYKNNHNMVMSLPTKVRLLLETAKGIKAVHYRKIAYMNLKESNILIDKELKCKINDFSYSVLVPANLKRNHLTRRCLEAPEYVWGVCSQQTDIFHMGCLMLQILLDSDRLTNDVSRAVRRAIQIESFENLEIHVFFLEMIEQCLPSGMFGELLEIGRACLSIEPTSRPGIDRIVGVLSDTLSNLLACDY